MLFSYWYAVAKILNQKYSLSFTGFPAFRGTLLAKILAFVAAYFVLFSTGFIA